MQAYLHTGYPNDFGFNSVEHYLEHEAGDAPVVTIEPESNQPLEEPKQAPKLSDN